MKHLEKTLFPLIILRTEYTFSIVSHVLETHLKPSFTKNDIQNRIKEKEYRYKKTHLRRNLLQKDIQIYNKNFPKMLLCKKIIKISIKRKIVHL